MKFHVNNEGNAGKCSAQKGKCPFGGEDAHHDSPEAARAAFEQAQSESSLEGVSKKTLQAQAEDLRETVRDYRHPATTEAEREQIRAHWESKGVKNQFSAMLRAAELDREAETSASGPIEPGATASSDALEAMPPASSVLWNGDLHRKGVDGHWYYGFGGSSRRSVDMDGATVKENADVPLHSYVATPELDSLMTEIDQLRNAFPPQVHEVRGMYDAVSKLRTTGDSRDYKFGLDLLRLRIEENEEFINEEAMDDRASVRWLGAVETAQRRLAQGW